MNTSFEFKDVFGRIASKPSFAAVVFVTAQLCSASQAGAAETRMPTWQEGCAARIVTPGPGDILRVNNCIRQSFCQNLANARGATVNFEAGCFGVAPEPQSQAPARSHRG